MRRMNDTLLRTRVAHCRWLPDDIERILYVNVITLMLQVMDEMVSGMAISFAGHNVKMQLSYLEAEDPDAANDVLSDRELATALATLDAKSASALRQLG
ncbi:hypothetical protein FOA52_005630 [Chlamydomonas sp. UWO 241]|nr:hypothetical protein FOA52_005630 [Chlamydomonas sp. UWO 241]